MTGRISNVGPRDTSQHALNQDGLHLQNRAQAGRALARTFNVEGVAEFIAAVKPVDTRAAQCEPCGVL